MLTRRHAPSLALSGERRTGLQLAVQAATRRRAIASAHRENAQRQSLLLPSAFVEQAPLQRGAHVPAVMRRRRLCTRRAAARRHGPRHEPGRVARRDHGSPLGTRHAARLGSVGRGAERHTARVHRNIEPGSVPLMRRTSIWRPRGPALLAGGGALRSHHARHGVHWQRR